MRMRNVRFLLMVIVMVAAALSACTSGNDRDGEQTPEEGPAAGPYEEDATVDEAVRLEPEATEPGGEVHIHFEDNRERGIGWALERDRDGEWSHEYTLVADSEEYAGDAPRWGPPGEVLIEDIAVGGPDPDRIRVPEGAEPGAWRVCHMDSPVYCAELTVASDP